MINQGNSPDQVVRAARMAGHVLVEALMAQGIDTADSTSMQTASALSPAAMKAARPLWQTQQPS
jgi:hypothetical protein